MVFPLDHVEQKLDMYISRYPIKYYIMAWIYHNEQKSELFPPSNYIQTIIDVNQFLKITQYT